MTGRLDRRAFLRGVGGAAVAAASGGGVATPAAATPAAERAARPLAHAYDRTVAAAWIAGLYDQVLLEGFSPPAAARAYAYGAVALYEAVVGGMPERQTLAGQLTGLPALPQPDARARYDWPSAASAAALAVANALFAASRDAFARLHGEQIASRRNAGVASAAIERALDLGRRVGERVAAWADDDGYAATVGRGYEPPVGRGLWERTPPNFGAAIEPYWGTLRPFALRSADECQPPPPIAYSEDPASAFYAQARRTYEVGLALTDEQRAIARFWTDNPRLSGLPAGHWLLIASQVIALRGLRLDGAVEVYARTALALADAFVSCWHEKYRTNLVRPVTYIKRFIDPAWNSFVNSPAFPEYTSGHSVASRAAATVLTDLFGTVAFTDDSHAPRGLPARSFASFDEAALEAATSRLYGGIHYQMGIDVGMAQGDRVGALHVARVRTRRGA
jgi:hypothetical protein